MSLYDVIIVLMNHDEFDYIIYSDLFKEGKKV